MTKCECIVNDFRANYSAVAEDKFSSEMKSPCEVMCGGPHDVEHMPVHTAASLK